jgi:serine protease AprX
MSVWWRRRLSAVVMGGLVIALGVPMAAAAAPSTASTTASLYVVSDTSGGGSSAAAADVSAVGGGLVSSLDALGAVSASLSSAQVAALGANPNVVVTPDVAISAEDASTATTSRAPAAVFPQQTGATQLWSQGDTGSGVNVAVIDTGIDNLPDFAGRLVGGVDLTGEGNPFQDDYGHGTFVAGLIAGDGASSNGAYTGEAPGAGLVSVKVAGATGQTDLATLLAGIGWVIQNRVALHIGVLNISFGVAPFESTVLNPLDQAVEAAWRSGLVVVTAAGNAGPFNGTILSPGDDPLVITAGALDDQGSTSSSGDTMTAFSSVGPTDPDGWFKPDLVASGRSVVSLRAPGSTVDQQFPSARIGTGNFVGSGTSFSAAITSGAAALLLQTDHGASPNDVKARLLLGATPGPVGNPFVDGHGELNLPGALATGPGNSVHLSSVPPGDPTAWGQTVSLFQTWLDSTWNPANYYGTGSAWNGTSWNGTSWNGSAWNGSAWNGSAWNGSAWNGTSWNGTSWNGSAWNGSAWNGSAWNGSAWNGTSWNGSAWNGSAWNGSAWNGTSWNGTSWNGTSWNGTSWNGTSWNGTSWNGASWG